MARARIILNSMDSIEFHRGGETTEYVPVQTEHSPRDKYDRGSLFVSQR